MRETTVAHKMWGVGTFPCGELELRERFEAMGLGAMTAVESHQTITLQTLSAAAAAAGVTDISPLADPLADALVHAADAELHDLPRITLRTTSATGQVAAGASSGGPHDLVELRVLAEGGMGRVLLARQTSLGREVAVKTLKSDAGHGELAALIREARVTGALEHPTIVPVHALGVTEEGEPLLVMKRVDGVSWQTLIAAPHHAAWSAHLGGDDQVSSLDAHLDILLAVCRSLELAHARGILHRDVKPDNVMVGAFGEVYLVDWGIAITMEEGARETRVLGTPAFMAPEMAKGAAVDVRSDVYLLGATLHRVLTGRARHEGDALRALLAAASSLPADYPADVPAPLADLCNRACAADNTLRPPTVRDFRNEVVAFQRHRSAVVIGAVARDRLAHLERLLADAGDGVPRDLAAAYRLGTEARFGFTQSLAQFPEQDAARDGVTRCVTALVDLELRQEHIETAAALLEELPRPPPALVARIDAARQTAAAGARERERLRLLDRALDPTVERRARVVSVAVLLPMMAAVTVVIALVGGATPNALAEVGIVAAIMTVTVTAMLVLRRRLLANAFNRSVVGMMLVIEAAILVHRIVGVFRQTSTPTTAAGDVLLFAAVLASSAVSTVPRLATGIPGLLVAMVLLYAYPERAAFIMPPAMLFTTSTIVWAITTHRRASAAAPASTGSDTPAA